MVSFVLGSSKLYELGLSEQAAPLLAIGASLSSKCSRGELAVSSFIHNIQESSDRMLVIYTQNSNLQPLDLHPAAGSKFSFTELARQYSASEDKYFSVCTNSQHLTFKEFVRKVKFKTEHLSVSQGLYSSHSDSQNRVSYFNGYEIDSPQELDQLIKDFCPQFDILVVVTTPSAPTKAHFLLPDSLAEEPDNEWKSTFPYISHKSKVLPRAPGDPVSPYTFQYPSYFDSGFWNALFALIFPLTVLFCTCCCFMSFDTPNTFETGPGTKAGWKI